MKKIVLSALAVAAFAGAASAQSVTYRIRERFNDTMIDVGDSPATGSATTAGNANDKTLWFVVEAQVDGLDAGTFAGLGGFAGSINITSGGGGGSYKAAGAAGTGGNPTNNSPVTQFVGPYPQGPGTQAVYAPFRLVSDLGAGGNGTRLSLNANSLTDIVGATGGVSLDLLQADIDDPGSGISNAGWGVGGFVPVYAFQYDVSEFTGRTLTFSTAFVGSTYFTSRDLQGVPNSIVFGQESQGSYSVTITPAPGAAALLGLGGLVAARRRRA